MHQPTHPSQGPGPAAGIGTAWCAWHEGFSVTARPVQAADGAVHFACLSCREAYSLTPLTDPS
ncbi:hypothetical protein AB0G76_37045 [Streptomyces asoensis]|uniref:hypothetical protein n=1 Tax=Streptomyces asoensis TaxID=249586 RepID=UPI0033D57A5A